MKASKTVLLVMLASTLWASPPSLLINQQNPYLGFGYGLGYWTVFTADINAAFGAGNVTVDTSPLTNLSYMQQFSALMVVPENPGQALTSTEVSNIAAYIATGGRVFLIGENRAWAKWDSSILGAVGGSYNKQDTRKTLTRVVLNGITMKQARLYTDVDGIAIGGTSLYSKNVLTMWGGNAVSLLSVDVLDDTSGANDGKFKVNIANWLAGLVVTTPEPDEVED